MYKVVLYLRLTLDGSRISQTTTSAHGYNEELEAMANKMDSDNMELRAGMRRCTPSALLHRTMVYYNVLCCATPCYAVAQCTGLQYSVLCTIVTSDSRELRTELREMRQEMLSAILSSSQPASQRETAILTDIPTDIPTAIPIRTTSACRATSTFRATFEDSSSEPTLSQQSSDTSQHQPARASPRVSFSGMQ